MVTIQGAHPHHHRHGWTRAEQGNFGLLVPTWREGLRAGLSLSPPDAALGPMEPEQSYQGFLLHQPPLKGTSEMAGCLGQEEEGTTRGICRLLCLVGRNSGARGETATPRDPQGMGNPTGGEGGRVQGHRFPARVQPARTACAPAPPANPNPWGLFILPVTHPEEHPVQPRLRAGPRRPPAVTGLQSSQHTHLRSS